MNWDNQDKDPWGGKNDAPDFDDLCLDYPSSYIYLNIFIL
jgi:hypothetical protein